MKNQGKWHLFTKEWGIRIFVVMLATLWLTLLAASWADAATGGAGSAKSEDDEYNFSWLDPEKKIYVLQNRRYTKSGRAMLSAMAGIGFSNPYRSTYTADPRFSFFVSEDFGVEAFYSVMGNHTNPTFRGLQASQPAIWPVVREVRSQYGLLAQWVPWYAKINVFNQILYFDWYFSAGAGTLETAVESRTVAGGQSTFKLENYTAFYLGTGHQYHLNNHWVVRLDFLSAIYKATVSGDPGDMAWYSNLNFSAGLGFRL